MWTLYRRLTDGSRAQEYSTYENKSGAMHAAFYWQDKGWCVEVHHNGHVVYRTGHAT